MEITCVTGVAATILSCNAGLTQWSRRVLTWDPLSLGPLNVGPLLLTKADAKALCGLAMLSAAAAATHTTKSRHATTSVLQPDPELLSIDTPRLVWDTKSSRSSRVAQAVVSRNGGIGRRAWFRSTFSQGSGGSSPLFGTNKSSDYPRLARGFFVCVGLSAGVPSP